MNLIFGRNGSGKTSVFDALRGILGNIQSGAPLCESFAPQDLTRWDSRSEQRFELDITLDGSHYEYVLRVQQDIAGNRSVLQEESITCDSKTLFAYREGAVYLYNNDGQQGTSFPFRGGRSFLPEMEPRSENRRLMRLLDHLRQNRILKLLPPTIGGVTTDESTSLASDGHNFASWYRHLAQERPAELHGLFENLQRAIPGFRSLALVGAGNQGRTRDLVAKLRSPGGGEHVVDFTELSDGQRALAVLYTLLVDLATEPGLVLLDKLTERFLRQLLEGMGFDKRRLHFSTAPSGRGAAEAWVRQRYVREVCALRGKNYQQNLFLVVVRHGDRFGHHARKQELDEQLSTSSSRPKVRPKENPTSASLRLCPRGPSKRGCCHCWEHRASKKIAPARRTLWRVSEANQAELPSLLDGQHELTRLDQS